MALYIILGTSIIVLIASLAVEHWHHKKFSDESIRRLKASSNEDR